MSIIGTRGATGKKTVNASTMFNNLFESEEPEEHHVDDSGLDETNLNSYGLLDPDGGSNWQGGVIRNIKSQTTTVTHNQSASGFIEGTILLVRRA